MAGPLAAVMLADQGADVIHIDPPGAPAWKSEADAFLNRGKRRITLDLKRTADREIARRLIATADVVIENFRPGVMDRLGLGPEAMTAANSHLIYCSIPGFGHDDARAGLPAWEGTIKAATGDCRTRLEDHPTAAEPFYSAIPVASNFGAFLTVVGAVAALIARHRSGRGQWIETPLFDAMFEAIGTLGVYRTDAGFQPPRSTKDNGKGTYRCADGRWVEFSPTRPRFLRWFARAAGVDAWAREGLLDEARLNAEPRLLRELRDRLTILFRTRTAAEWEGVGNQAGTCLCMVRTGAEWLADEHARATGAVASLTDPDLGETWMAGLPSRLSGTPGAVSGPRHRPDADRDDILGELGAPAPRPAATAAEPGLRRALEGLTVVDLTLIYAGPTAGRMLGELGADVIKINPPKRGGDRLGFANRGKTSILLDVEREEGQRVFWELARTADVITQNFPEGTMERYGIGYEQISARNPDVLYSTVSCYGYGGPYGAWRGFETQGQAMTGMVERMGDAVHGPGILGPYNLVDYGAGVLSTFAVLLGLYHRYRSGEGQQVQTALVMAGTYHSATFLMGHAGKVWDEPRGLDTRGPRPLQRFYRTSDGWLFVGGTPGQLSAVLDVLGLRAVPPQGAALERALEEAFAKAPLGPTVAALQAAGLGAHARVELADLVEDPGTKARGLTVVQTSATGERWTVPGLPIRLSRTPMVMGDATAVLGGDGVAVLARVGWAAKRAELERAWALEVPDA